MKRLVIAAMVGLASVPAWAGPGILPVKGVKHASYDLASGTLTPGETPVRYGDPVWACTEGIYYWPTCNVLHDWGDCGDPDCPYEIGGFLIAYATQLVLPDRVTAVIAFYGDDNGWYVSSPTYLEGFLIPNLPTADPGGAWNAWYVWIDLDAAGYSFTLAGDDLDGDGLVDFGYTYWFWDTTCSTGPQITDCHAPGVEDGWEEFRGPNLIPFGNEPTRQINMALFAEVMECNFPGASGNYCSADINCGCHPCDCFVGLADLGRLLATYGLWPGDPGYDAIADLYDDPSSPGYINLADLGVLLAQYGDDCNVP